MSNPSWLPTEKSNWPDYTSYWQRIVTGAFNKWSANPPPEDSVDQGLFDAIGELLSYVEQYYQWIVDSIIPDRDDNKLFLARWETLFGITPSDNSSVSDRQSAVKSSARLLGKTATRQIVKTIFAPIFDTTSSKVGFEWASMEAIEAVSPETAWEYATCIFNFHIYNTDETGSILKKTAFSLIQRFAPATHYVSVGPYKRAICGRDNTVDMSTVG